MASNGADGESESPSPLEESSNLPLTQSQSVFKRLRSLQENKQCFDCRRHNPTWASIPFGVFLCFDCAGVHRNLGTHISFIRSTELDVWRTDQISRMVAGGNLKAATFFKSKGMSDYESSPPREKYTSRVAKLYKVQLDKLAKDVQAEQFSSASPRTSLDNVPIQSAEDGLDALMKEALSLEQKKAEAPTPTVVKPVEAAPKRVVVIKKNPKPAESLSAAPKAANLSSAPVASGVGLRSTAPRSKLMLSTAPIAGKSTGSSATASAQAVSASDDIDFDAPPEIAPKVETPEPQAPSLLKPKASKAASAASSASTADRFKNAKSISSDQYFGKESDGNSMESQYRAEKFSNSRAISSDDYFGRTSSTKDAPAASSQPAAPMSPLNLSAIGNAVKSQLQDIAKGGFFQYDSHSSQRGL